MDRRRRPMSLPEEVAAREELERLLAAHSEWDVATVLRTIRETLHLTLVDMARVGRISVPTLKNIEARRGSPTQQTLEGLLHPFGYRLAVVRASPGAAAEGSPGAGANATGPALSRAPRTGRRAAAPEPR